MNFSAAYQQMILEKVSHIYMAINTQKSLFKYIFAFIIWNSISPSCFQHAMGMILQGLPQDNCYLYNILIMGPTHEEHLQRSLPGYLTMHGLRLKKEKCSFMQDSIKYFGDITQNQQVSTQQQARSKQFPGQPPVPKNVSQFHSFLEW